VARAVPFCPCSRQNNCAKSYDVRRGEGCRNSPNRQALAPPASDVPILNTLQSEMVSLDSPAMTPRLRKIVLVTHIVFSVGWLGAIVPYLALAVAGLNGDAQTMRATYLSMEMIGWYVIVPFSLAAMLSGVVQALGTQWGLFRHWWVSMKFLLTIASVVILLKHMQDVSGVARVVKENAAVNINFGPELIHAGGGLLVLLAITILSVFKPWGLTPYGRSRSAQAYELREEMPRLEPVLAASRPQWGRIIGIHAVILLLLAAILHATGIHHH